jgi:hypothetical protein
MRAIILKQFGGLDSLVIENLPDPVPQPGVRWPGKILPWRGVRGRDQSGRIHGWPWAHHQRQLC